MTKKTISKVIAMVCVAALMFAVVFTGAVSAESANCVVEGYAYNPGTVDDYVTYKVTFTSSTAFTAGSFTITPPTGLHFVDCKAKVSSVNAYVPKVYLNVANNKVLFAGFEENAIDDITQFTSLTLLLMFAPDTADTAIKDAPAGTTWSMTVGDISITNKDEATYTCDNASGTAHIHNFTGATTANGVTTRTCSICSAEDKTIDTSTATIGGNNLADTQQATLNFTDDGDTVLCALVAKNTIDALGGTTYFSYKYKDDSGFNYATTKGYLSGDYYVFECGRNGGIGRMSRNITGNFINVSGTTTISGEWSHSVMEYLAHVISSGTAVEQNYAKALWNYGYYTTERLADNAFGYFVDERDAYGGTVYSDIASWGLPGSKQATFTGTGSWTVSGVKVETGYKPKMQFKLNADGQTTVEAYSAAGDLVYKKTITATSGEYFTISDIPTKYLTGNLKISMSGSTKVVEYSFGKYAKAREGKTDANVFLWLMSYSYYLGEAFA